MLIVNLPRSAIQSLGSSQVLTNPVSAVKELVENALDASASSITVEISANTLDVIQVNDNGHGIAPDDRDNVARRHATSKIRSMADLRSLGGRSLGFRGEALSSAAEMTDSMTITTRIDGEAVGRKWTISKAGTVSSEERASHLIGTTVRILNFLNLLPVRKEAALRKSCRALTQIRELLYRYAMARPTVRFSLKILNGNSGALNWTYAPKENRDIIDAAMQVVGREVAKHCTFHRSEFDANGTEDTAPRDANSFFSTPVCTSHGKIIIEAFLPRAESDPAKVGCSAQYISIDSRPISPARGFAKEIVGLFKQHARSALLSSPSSQHLKRPFMFMDIVCPPGIYDPNIEPAKDDVLFQDPKRILQLIEIFFHDFYRKSEAAGLGTTSEPDHIRPQHDVLHGFREEHRQTIAAEPTRSPARSDRTPPPLVEGTHLDSAIFSSDLPRTPTSACSMHLQSPSARQLSANSGTINSWLRRPSVPQSTATCISTTNQVAHDLGKTPAKQNQLLTPLSNARNLAPVGASPLISSKNPTTPQRSRLTVAGDTGTSPRMPFRPLSLASREMQEDQLPNHSGPSYPNPRLRSGQISFNRARSVRDAIAATAPLHFDSDDDGDSIMTSSSPCLAISKSSRRRLPWQNHNFSRIGLHSPPPIQSHIVTQPSYLPDSTRAQTSACRGLQEVPSTQSLVFTLPFSLPGLETRIHAAGRVDDYISSGKIGSAFDTIGILDAVGPLESSVRRLVERKYQSSAVNGGVIVKLDLKTALEEHRHAGER